MFEPGFTAVVCRSQRCGVHDAGTVAETLFAALGAVVAESTHGVLVSAGCLFGSGLCDSRPKAPIVVVQPCDADRRPVSAAVRVGPLRVDADVEALVEWLRRGRLDARLLPAHLTRPPARPRRA